MPSRNTQLTFAWILIAFLMLGIAAWQVQLTLARDAAAKNAPLPPPLKTRHATRPAATTFNGDPVADYIARCGKGIADQEIRWIIKDFKIAELDVEWRNPELTEQRILQLITRQQKWYVGSLKDGLRLDSVQTLKASESLGKIFHAAADEFIAERKKSASPEFGPIPTVRERDGFARLPGAPSGGIFPAPPFMPWKLCDLTVGQKRITWNGWYQSLEEKQVMELEHVSPPKLAKLTGGPEFQLAEPGGSITANTPAPNWAMFPDLILPILKQQELTRPARTDDPFAQPSPPNTETLLSNIRRLHPAQLKLLLLFAPEMAAEISKELQAPPR